MERFLWPVPTSAPRSEMWHPWSCKSKGANNQDSPNQGLPGHYRCRVPMWQEEGANLALGHVVHVIPESLLFSECFLLRYWHGTQMSSFSAPIPRCPSMCLFKRLPITLLQSCFFPRPLRQASMDQPQAEKIYVFLWPSSHLICSLIEVFPIFIVTMVGAY